MCVQVKVQTKGAFKHLNNMLLEVAEMRDNRVTILDYNTGNLIDFTIKEVVSIYYNSKILNHR